MIHVHRRIWTDRTYRYIRIVVILYSKSHDDKPGESTFMYLSFLCIKEEIFWRMKETYLGGYISSVPDPFGSINFGLPESGSVINFLDPSYSWEWFVKKLVILSIPYVYFLLLVTNTIHLPWWKFFSTNVTFKKLFLLTIAPRRVESGPGSVKFRRIRIHTKIFWLRSTVKVYKLKIREGAVLLSCRNIKGTSHQITFAEKMNSLISLGEYGKRRTENLNF
jgi:hypothetical protein